MGQSNLNPAASKPGGRRKAWPPRSSAHAAVIEAYKLELAVERLSVRLRRFVNRHRGRTRPCRCPVCRDVATQGWPDLFDTMEAVASHMRNSTGLINCDRPMARPEYDEIIRRNRPKA